jgi:hypothetical protein
MMTDACQSGHPRCVGAAAAIECEPRLSLRQRSGLYIVDEMNLLTNSRLRRFFR